MTWFRLHYVDPKTDAPTTHDCEFEDWSDEVNGLYISAEEWARDFGYSLADKGPVRVEQLSG